MKVLISVMALILLQMFVCVPAWGHHLWIEPAEDNAWLVVRGLIAERMDEYDPECVQEIQAYGEQGEELDVERQDLEDQVRFTASKDLAMATVWSKWGYRVNTTKGKKLITRKEAESKGLKVLSAFYSTQYAKSLFHWNRKANKPTGLRFEIIPLQNPLQAEPGTPIEVQVLFDAKPLADATLYTAQGEEKSTDAQGMAQVEVPREDIALLYAKHRIDVEGDARKDFEVFRTFLTYEVQE
ncbi:MAG: DUF4198 domain-containing protein [Desulfovermiculus sp.]